MSYRKKLLKIQKNLKSIYALTKIEQDALDLCQQYDKDCSNINFIIEVILDKFKITLSEFEGLIK